MAGISLTGEADLGSWLNSRPRLWSQIIALRSGLRSLALSSQFFENSRSRLEAQSLTLTCFRGAIVSWTSLRHGENEDTVRNLAKGAARAAKRARDKTKMLTRSTRPLRAVEAAAGSIGYPGEAIEYGIDAAYSSAAAAGDYQARISTSNRGIRARNEAAYIWRSISADALFLVEANSSEEVDSLLMRPLWPKDPPAYIVSSLDVLRRNWTLLDRNSSVWVDWLSSRIDGFESFGWTPRMRDL